MAKMIFTETKLKGAYIIERKEDARNFLHAPSAKRGSTHMDSRQSSLRLTLLLTFGKVPCEACIFNSHPQPKRNLSVARRGGEQLYAAYQQYGVKLEEFEGPRYKRIDYIKQLLSTGQLDETLRWRKVAEVAS